MEYQFSERVKSLKPSAIREILKNSSDPSVIPLSAGNPAPDAFPYEAVQKISQELLQNTPIDALQYGVTEGYTPLRQHLKGYMAQNPGIVPIHFAEGEGFKQEVAANVGCRKGSDKLLKLIDKTLKGISQEERDQMWDACLDRQPA